MRKLSRGFNAFTVLTKAFLSTAISSYVRFWAFSSFGHRGKEPWQMEAGSGPPYLRLP